MAESQQISKQEEKQLKKAAKKASRQGRYKRLWQDFKAFISKGNVLDMAVGVIMGSAFNAIVTAFTNILLSICTWGVPGGLSGLVTVLPPINAAQNVPSDITVGGNALQNVYSVADWATLSQESDFTATIGAMYTKHGGNYYYNGVALIDWGTFINAVIAFLIIALTLFVIVKTYSSLKNRRLAFQAEVKRRLEEEKAKKEGRSLEEEKEETQEETPAEPEPVKDPHLEVLEEIRDEIKRLNEAKNKS